MAPRRMGLELELLTPLGADRDDAARAFADRVGGLVLYGFKHRVDGEVAPGRPRCWLTPACRVVDRYGVDVAWVVDDPTVRAGDGPPGTRPVVVADDTRLSTLAARVSWSSSSELEHRLDGFRSTFDGSWHGRRLLDRNGEILLATSLEPLSHARACEFVSAVLDDDDAVDEFVGHVVAVAADVGCVVPDTAALHVHLDAAPFQDVNRLANLITGWNSRREHHLERLRTNRRCLKLGAFPDHVVKVASGRARIADFTTFAVALSMAGVKKDLDLNLKGVIDRHPAQPTLEIRCLPMSLDAAAIRRSIDDAVALVDALAAGGDVEA